MSLAPYDTGNLRHNAIKILRRKNGFTIKYSAVDAYYIQFVEEGTKTQKGQGFIEKTYITLANYFANVENGIQMLNQDANKEAKNKLNMELYRENPDYRRLVHRESIFQHYQTQGTENLYRRKGE